VARTAVIAGTATSVSNRVSRRQANRWAAKDEQAAAEQQAQQQQQYAPPPQQYAPPPEQYAAPPAPAAASSDRLAQLQQLGELHTSGVLTDAEFQVQKERILAG
jgi:hypothetical protein